MQDAFSQISTRLLTTNRSFYNLIDTLWKGKHTKDPLHQIFSLMRKMKVRSYLLEPLLPNTELNEERDMAERRCGGSVGLEAKRITFFCSLPKRGRWEDPDILPDNHLLGYVVVVTLTLPNRERRSYILEAVIRPPSAVFLYDEQEKQQVFIEPITNYYIHNVRRFETIIGTSTQHRSIPIVGSFFSQQNDLTSVCAHAALRMAINSSPMFQNTKLTNKQINDILDIDFSSPNRCVGHYPTGVSASRRGLTAEELEEVVIRVGGGRIIPANFQENASIEYDQFIYPIVESGYPVIIGAEGWDTLCGEYFGHALTVLGHTMNSDRWGPEARYGYRYFPMVGYLPAVEWADHLVIGDDNYGIYLTLSTDMIRNFIVPTKNPNLHAARAIGIVPREVTISGYMAEQIAVKMAQEIVNHIINLSTLYSPGIWLTRLSKSKFVCRTLLVSKPVYLAHIDNLLRIASAHLPPDIRNEFDRLPDYIWVSEISLPHVYTANKHKLGEVVLGTNVDPRNALDAFLFAWVPGFIIFASDLKPKSWPLITHVPLLRLSDESNLLEC